MPWPRILLMTCLVVVEWTCSMALHAQAPNHPADDQAVLICLPKSRIGRRRTPYSYMRVYYRIFLPQLEYRRIGCRRQSTVSLCPYAVVSIRFTAMTAVHTLTLIVARLEKGNTPSVEQALKPNLQQIISKVEIGVPFLLCPMTSNHAESGNLQEVSPEFLPIMENGIGGCHAPSFP